MSSSFAFSESVLRVAEVKLRVELLREATGIGPSDKFRSLAEWLRLNPEVFLDLLDFLLSSRGDSARSLLEDTLSTGGSMWAVRQSPSGSFELQRRVSDVAEAQFAATVEAAPAPAAVHLREAWSAMYGRNPDPQRAYDQAVKAVESVVDPMVIPNDPSSTLGSALKAFEAKPTKWIVHPRGRTGDSYETMLSMLQAIWKNQPRHGTEEGTEDASPEDAEAALHLSITVVFLVSVGLVAQSPPSS